jgi:tetratricopeptide (TPR) repeat protein
MHSKRDDEARSNLLKFEYELAPLSDTSSEQERAQHAQVAAEWANLEYLSGNYDEASQYAQQAFELGSESPAALMIHIETTLGMRPGWNSNGNLEPADLKTVLDMLMVVLRYNFKNERAHVAHSYAWASTDVKPLESHIGALIQACGLFPENKAIHFNLAQLFDRLGRDEDTKAVLVHLINNTNDPATRADAEALLAEVEKAE